MLFWLFLLVIGVLFSAGVVNIPAVAGTLATVAVVLFAAVVIAALAAAAVYLASTVGLRRTAHR